MWASSGILYFEGRKEGSVKARHGCSKEKRSDCKLPVLALCINAEGFIRYSSILAGNTSDPDSLPDMIDTLSEKTRTPSAPDRRTLVCLDAGIARRTISGKSRRRDMITCASAVHALQTTNFPMAAGA